MPAPARSDTGTASQLAPVFGGPEELARWRVLGEGPSAPLQP